MSVERVTVNAAEPHMWATPDDLCFHCGDPLTAGKLAVTWAGFGSTIRWHPDCAAQWGAAFMRDVWEAGHASRHAQPPGKDKYAEPDWGITR